MSGDDRSKGSGKETKPVVRVERRRRSDSAGAEGRDRAQAPRRERREDRGRTRPSSSTSRPRPAGGTGLPALPSNLQLPALSGRSMLLVVVLGLVCLCAIAAFMLLGGGGDGADQLGGLVPQGRAPVATEVPPTPGMTVKPFVPPTGTADGQTWLVMLYMDADDKILEQDIYVDLNEAERVGSSDNVRIVAQLDRFSAGYSADGNWTSTRRYYVTQDDDLGRVGSELVADLGELNMADGDTLIDFATWAIETFPADKHVLILSDHGMGWPGGWSDPAPGGRGDGDTPLAASLGNQLYLDELDAALKAIRDRSGLDKFEVIGLDACLMGQIEVFNALAPHARFAVASEETEPALGWAYTSFLEGLARDPGMSGAELGDLIVGSYVEDDQRIVDDEARAELMRQSSPLGSLFGLGGSGSAAQVADQMGRNSTLTAADLSRMPALIDSLNDLAFSLQDVDQSSLARARTYAQSFTSIFGKQVPPSFVDLGSLVRLLREAGLGREVDGAVDRVLAALGQTVVAEKHGSGVAGATGLSIYFPNSQLYSSPAAGPQSYTAIAQRFAGESLWDDLLTFHYTGTPFDAAARRPAVPAPDAAVAGPGAGAIRLTPLELSDTVAAPGRPVLLSTDVSGPNLGYLFLFTGYLDRGSNSIWVADTDYLESSDTREIEGVYYPVWPEGEFTVEFEWEPLVFAINDGTSSVTALLSPVTYGAAPEEATYVVDGIYTYASGEARAARLYFRDGLLRQVFGFTGDGTVGAPREIYPERGDTFTVQENWLDLDDQGQLEGHAAEGGDTLTFGDQMFSWEELYAAPGDYVVGIIAEDLDGTRYAVYANVTVE